MRRSWVCCGEDSTFTSPDRPFKNQVELVGKATDSAGMPDLTMSMETEIDKNVTEMTMRIRLAGRDAVKSEH